MLHVMQGLVVALATIFSDDESPDYRATAQLARDLADAGVDGFLVAGTTGEVALLEVEERKRLAEAVIGAVGARVPVMVQVGTAREAASRELSRHAAGCGAAALCLLTPYYYRYPAEVLLSSMIRVIQDVAGIPWYLYNIPQRTTNDLTPEMFRVIQEACPQVVGLKNTQTDVDRVAAYTGVADIDFFIGADSLILLTALMGGKGFISGPANAVPEPYVRFRRAWSAENWPEAMKAQQAINLLQELVGDASDISLVKAAIAARGRASAVCRKPWPTRTSEIPRMRRWLTEHPDVVR
ncbi:MAG: dihydrodipicolinate synthase family protein [Thermaerobacter sp.]|nr:dihydrodipicolinate synthase family protein [Thermaerobacter sp.]